MSLPTRIASISVLLAVWSGVAAAQVGGGYDASSRETQSAGTVSSGGGFTLSSVVGQADGTSSNGGGYLSEGGHVPGLCTGTISVYGSGCPGLGGFVPQLRMAGCADFGEQIRFEISDGVGGGQAFIFLGLGQGSAPMGAGCNLLTIPLLPAILGPVPLSPGGAGAGAVAFPTAVGNIPGVTVTLQVFVVDTSTLVGFANSNGVSIFHG